MGGPVSDDAKTAAVTKLHLILTAAWKDFARDYSDGVGTGTRDALLVMAAYAMQSLAAIGFTAKDIEHLWAQVVAQPSTLRLMEQVRDAAEAAERTKRGGLH